MKLSRRHVYTHGEGLSEDVLPEDVVDFGVHLEAAQVGLMTVTVLAKTETRGDMVDFWFRGVLVASIPKADVEGRSVRLTITRE